jgi:hypothetical protein
MKDLQEVKRGVGNEGSTDPTRGDITGSSLGVPSGSLGPDSDVGHVD